MIRAIIFDWFGVCVERWIPVWERELGPKVDPDLFEKYFLLYLDDYADNSISGQQFLDSVFREINVEPKGYYYLLKKLGRLNQDLLDIILKMREVGYKTAILSDNFNEIVPVIEEKIGGFDKYFDVICLSNWLGIGKRNQEIYIKTRDLLREYGIEEKNCIFVDDRQKNLDMAERIGWTAVLYESNSQLKAAFSRYAVIVG